MKRSKLMLLVIGAAIIFFGCEKMEPVPPELDQSNGAIASLKCTKVKRTFEGICSPVSFSPDNTWYDAMDDWRVTGTTIWKVTGADGLSGTAELFVDAKNPHEENRGKWEMEWKFVQFEIGADGASALVVAAATGEGVEGKVKGLEAEWTYTMNFVGDLTDFPSLMNPTSVYEVEGSIEKNNGDHGKSHKNRH